jgi:excisionase family DNA binding protein
MTDLYSTNEAAGFLGVSEASVRRWGDQGLLPVLRIGRRRTRRFRVDNLREFAANGQVVNGFSAAAESPDSVVVGRVRVELHSHLSDFYDSDAGRLRIAVPFLRDGLKAGQQCFLYAFDDVRNDFVNALRKEDGIDVDGALTAGQLVLMPAVKTSARQFLDSWEQTLLKATMGKHRPIRALGEMTSVRRLFPSDEEMFDFETAFSALVRRFPVVVLCQYDAREFDGQAIMAAIKAHPDIFELRLSDFLT